MGVDMDAMRRGYEEQQHSGGEYLSFEKGETLLLVHPPCRDNDTHEPTKGKNFVPVTVHYSVGKNKKMIVSLDPEANPIIDHPFVKKALKKKKVRLTGKCPVTKALKSGKMFTDEEADESRAQTKYLWGVTPMGFRKKSSGAWQEHDKQGEPTVAMVGKQIFDGLMELFFDHGDISDPTAAILVRVIKSGKKRQTKYVVKVDADTAKKPKKLSKKIRAALAKAMVEDGDCDLFRVVANMIKSPDEVTAILKGVEVDEEPDDDEEIDDEEIDDEDDVEDIDDDEDDEESDDDEDDEESDDDDEESDDEDDEEPDDEDDDEESDDDDEEPDDDDEDDDEEPDDEDDDEESDDDEEPDDEDDDEESDDEDDDDEDDEPEPPKKGKGKGKGKGKASKKSDDEDDDDLGLDDLDEALEDLDVDDDEEPPKKGKASKKKATKKKAAKSDAKKGKGKATKKAAKSDAKKGKGKATKKAAKSDAKKGKGAKKKGTKKKGKKGKK